jgi:methylated-DNA-[protein]-cysteine S-methyltransferase
MNDPFVTPADGEPARYHEVDSPIGRLRMFGDGSALTGLYMLGGRGRVARIDGPWRHDPAAFAEVEAQLRAYFAGELTTFDVPLAPRGTDFHLRVWAELTRIPYGTTVSYGEIARRLGLGHDRSRAVGAANGANPICLFVPCHRVIGADGSLVGYGGGLERKRLLLEHEGVLMGSGTGPS